jgi:hypothetical protein
MRSPSSHTVRGRRRSPSMYCAPVRMPIANSLVFVLSATLKY